MASFLMNCPQCNLMIPKGGPCPECHWSEKDEEDVALDRETLQEFARREMTHKRNYTIFMGLSLATALVGGITAFMWWKLIYLGDVIALVWIGLLTVLTGVLSVMLTFSRKLFPVELNCPSCDIRLDELQPQDGHCPNCSAPLRLEASQGAGATEASPV
jgi:hypothetical protein